MMTLTDEGQDRPFITDYAIADAMMRWMLHPNFSIPDSPVANIIRTERFQYTMDNGRGAGQDSERLMSDWASEFTPDIRDMPDSETIHEWTTAYLLYAAQRRLDTLNRETKLPLALAAERCGITADSLRQAIHRKTLRGEKIGRDWFVGVNELDRYIAAVPPNVRATRRTRSV